MKINIVVVLLFMASLCQAQTKVIAHKSHSGSNRSFSKAYQKKSVDLNRSNFGLPGSMGIIVLDSVVAVNDSVTILKMRESKVCYPYGTNYRNLKSSDFKFKTITLTNDGVFNRKNTITFIKISNNYSIRFDNSIDQVVFIGFKK